MNKRDTPRHWTPLRQLQRSEMRMRIEVVRESAAHYGISEDEARAMLERQNGKCSYYANDLYQVELTEHDGVTQLCIRRRDGAASLRDWRHFQQIKNELCGPEREGFELYPAESRKVDTSNKYHIWVLPDGDALLRTVGWSPRDGQYYERRDGPGLRQRTV